MNNQYRINITDPIRIQEAAAKTYVGNMINDPSIIKNTAQKDLNDRNITNARFVEVNHLPQIDSHLPAKLYVENAISNSADEPAID